MDDAVRADHRQEQRHGRERPQQQRLQPAQRDGLPQPLLDRDDPIGRSRWVQSVHLGPDRVAQRLGIAEVRTAMSICRSTPGWNM